MKAKELLERIESRSAPVIVDARMGIEFRRGHVPGAVHIPFQMTLLRSAGLPKDKSLEVVIYCGHGPRAWIAKQLLAVRGYGNVGLLEGHMKGWRKAGLPLERQEGA
jgi:rhodanese-related sulfurtransferase